MNGKPDVRPSGWYALLALPFALAGITIFIYALIHGVSHVTDSLVQVVVPGESQLELKQANSYDVFLERQSVVNGKVYSTDGSVNGLQCNLVPVSGVEKIEMRPARMSTTYDVGGRSGRSIFQFRVLRDGAYTFACGYGETARGPEVVLAIGSGVGEGIMRTISISIVALFGGMVLAAGVVVCVFVLRARSRKMRTIAPSPL